MVLGTACTAASSLLWAHRSCLWSREGHLKAHKYCSTTMCLETRDTVWDQHSIVWHIGAQLVQSVIWQRVETWWETFSVEEMFGLQFCKTVQSTACYSCSSGYSFILILKVEDNKTTICLHYLLGIHTWGIYEFTRKKYISNVCKDTSLSPLRKLSLKIK